MRNLFIVLVISGLGFLGYEYAYGKTAKPAANGRESTVEQEGRNEASQGSTPSEEASILVADADGPGQNAELAWKRAVQSQDYSHVEVLAAQRDALTEGSAARYALEVGLGMKEGSGKFRELSDAAAAYSREGADTLSEKSSLLAAGFALLAGRGRLEGALAALGVGNTFLDGEKAKAGITAFIAQLGSKRVEDEEASLLLSQLLDRMTRGGPVWGQTEHFPELAQVYGVHQEVLGRVFFNSAGHWRSTHHKVKANDNLETVSNRYARELGIPLARGFLAKINGIPNPDLLRLGKSLRIPTGTISGVVELASHSIKIWVDDLLIRVYQVGLGKPESPTPVGIFTIVEKQINPVWYPPGGGSPVPAGDKRNPLGRYFLKFAHEHMDGYGLHGTKDQASVGQNQSLGCVRMRGEDMDDLFQILPRGSKIRIRR